MRRIHLLYILLFTGSFAARSGYIVLQQPDGTSGGTTPASLGRRIADAVRGGYGTALRSEAGGSQPSGAAGPATPAEGKETGVDAKTLETARTAQFASVVVNNTDPVERKQAIGELVAIASPEALYALATAAQAADFSVRFAAVDSLRVLAANQGDGEGRIREILRTSLGDANTDIASRARDAIAEIDSLQAN